VRAIYSFLVHIAWFHLKLIAYLKPKIKLFVEGRKSVFAVLENSITNTDAVIWMHVASLGEYEQGLPILQKLKTNYPKHKLLLTFFSPSGYEIKKNTKAADIVTYLPLDTISNAEKFIQLVNPKLTIFIKYEIWPNYLNTLQKKEIPTFLVSALFSKRQTYFKWYGEFMRKSLKTFNHFFVQDENSLELLKTIDFTNTTVSGDTRFDRVSEILERDNTLSFMTKFKQDKFCFVAGSSWPEDEKIIVEHINNSKYGAKYVIAPHNIKEGQIKSLKESISKRTILYSEIGNKQLEDFEVLLVDTIGLLTKIYSYADIAYVGGGFKTGLHNTLEPAVFGIPILIGPNYKGFKEAEDLVEKGGTIVIKNKDEFSNAFKKLFNDKSTARQIGQINKKYTFSKTGATTKLMNHLKQIL
jgi:3-deoxy-D-manno-octulosonic-acid transferase